MLSRLLASWLVVLIVAPFTAPFSTCDLSMFALSPPVDKGQIPRARRVPSASDALSDDLPIPSAPVALSNDVAIPGASSMVRAGRSRLLRAFRVSVRANVPPSSSATVLTSAVTMPHGGEETALRTVLRV